jgi:hypothetical protein|tara:strand:+ start:897 stop:1622 length:726 start_codon:yes stop_codon:yes gene_type:complete
MKNVYIYNVVEDNIRYDNELLLNYFRAQVDNSLRFGWKKEDIIIGTNFDFEHNGVKNIKLENICTTNIFNNKWYGMLELMNNGYIDDDFWFHDQDSWQVSKVEFPEFVGEIGGCTYVYTPEWNTCSMFLKQTSVSIVEYIVEFMKINDNTNFYSDENYISLLRGGSPIQDYLTTLNNKFNVGLTHMEKRYQAAEKPVCSLGFQPHVQSSWDVFIEGKNDLDLKLIDNEMIELFKTYNLVPE